MLALLRRKAQSPYIQATVVAIIVVFMLWIPASNQGPGRNDVATVNGEPISYAAFQQAYEQTLDVYRQRFGGTIPEALRKQLNLEKQVLNRLINQTLLRQGGRNMGVHISDAEVQNYIKHMPVFQVNNSFDKMRYEETLKNAGTTQSKYEESVRTSLLTARVARYINNFSTITPLEIDNYLDFLLSERRIDYVSLKGQDFLDQVKITDEKLQEYFETNKNNYKTPPKVKLQYLFFSKESNSTTISEARIEEYYHRHQDDYYTPEKRRARHILLKVESGANATAQYDKMEKILARVESGEDFSDLASQYSEDKASASKGGDLGYFGRGAMVKPFEEKAFAMEKGEVSDIVRTPFGLHIIKVTDINPAGTRPLAEVKEDIEKILLKQEAEQAAFARAGEAYEGIITAGSLKAYADNKGISPEETDFFSNSDAPEPLSANPAVLSKIFQLNKGELSSIIEGAQGYFIIFVKDRRAPMIPELTEVKEMVEMDMKRDLASDLAREKAEEVLKKARESNEPAAALGNMPGIEVASSDFFSRDNKKADIPARVIAAAFTLTEKEPYPGEVINSRGNFYVIRLREIRKPTAEQIKERKERFRKELAGKEQDQLLNAWVNHLMQKGEVRVNEERLDL